MPACSRPAAPAFSEDDVTELIAQILIRSFPPLVNRDGTMDGGMSEWEAYLSS